MNRRIAVGLILTLLAQSFLPGVALAWRAEPSPGETLLICTGDGVKEIALDPAAQGDQPRAQQCCPCAIPCSACALPGVDRIGERVVYAVAAPPRMQLEPVTPTAAHPPPPHHSRAPPLS